MGCYWFCPACREYTEFVLDERCSKCRYPETRTVALMREDERVRYNDYKGKNMAKETARQKTGVKP